MRAARFAAEVLVGAILSTAIFAVLALLSVLLASGCAAPSDPEASTSTLRDVGSSPEVPRRLDLEPSWRVVVDPAVPPSRVEALRSALRDWQAASPCGFSFELVSGPTGSFDDWPPPPLGTIEVREVSAPSCSSPLGKPIGCGQWFAPTPRAPEGGGSRVEVLASVPDSDLARVLRHELGHALHLPHDSVAEPSVMATSGAWPEIQPADSRAIGRIWCSASP